MPSDQCPVIQGGHWGSYPGGNWGSYPGWALGILSRVGTGDPIQGGHWGSYPGWALGILGRKKMVGDCSNQMLLRARRRHRARANSLLRGPAGVLWPLPPRCSCGSHSFLWGAVTCPEGEQNSGGRGHPSKQKVDCANN
eukprot:gene12492-biopygen19958